jgi:hypothetical protein
MIYVKENILDSGSVMICVDGVLDYESIPILREIYEGHAKRKINVFFNLKGVFHISREGRDFLHSIREKGIHIEPDFT